MPSRSFTCATCGKPLEPDAVQTSPVFPFCSRRCKDVDLLRWFDGRYAVVNDMDPETLWELQARESGGDPEVELPR